MIEDTAQLAMDESGSLMIKLILNCLLILIFGIVVWRVMMIFAKKSTKPRESTYFKHKHHDKWRR